MCALPGSHYCWVDYGVNENHCDGLRKKRMKFYSKPRFEHMIFVSRSICLLCHRLAHTHFCQHLCQPSTPHPSVVTALLFMYFCYQFLFCHSPLSYSIIYLLHNTSAPYSCMLFTQTPYMPFSLISPLVILPASVGSLYYFIV